METRRRIVIVAAALLFSVASLAGTGRWALAGQEGSAQKLCPVLGGEINKSVYTDYDGKRVYFCCEGCIETFRQDPDRYIEKMESQGIVLEDAPKGGSGAAMKSGSQHEATGHTGAGHGGHMDSMHGMH